jgi:hypothetical protein
LANLLLSYLPFGYLIVSIFLAIWIFFEHIKTMMEDQMHFALDEMANLIEFFLQ